MRARMCWYGSVFGDADPKFDGGSLKFQGNHTFCMQNLEDQ